MKKRIASLLLTLALCGGLTVPAAADQEFALQGQYTSGAYTYSLLDDGTAMIVEFNKNYSTYTELETLTIPATLDGYQVTSIGTYSFSYNFPIGVKTVIIPEGVKYINSGAFSTRNADTTSLQLPTTLESIGENAFNGWQALQTLVIPENVTSIGKNAFFVFGADDSKGLKTVICYARDIDFHMTTIFDNTPFDGCVNCTFYGYPGSALERLVKTSLTGNTFEDIANTPDIDLPAQPQQPAAPAFSDVAADAYYAAPVAWAVEKGITNGTSDTTFSPDATCTRAQIITFLWRAAGSPEPNSLKAFTDVQSDTYYAKAAAWAAENGMAGGSTFSPDAPCTRETAVEFMWKHAGSPDAAAAAFTDVSSAAVNWAVEKSVTNGTSETTFSPDATCTRGQIVTFLYRGFAE